MALNIKDKETEELAAEVAELTGDTKTGAVREALREKRDRASLAAGSKGRRRPRTPGSLERFMEQEIWPFIPGAEKEQEPLTKEEIEDILGFGPDGY